MEVPFFHLKSVTSTNDEAKKLAASLPEAIVIADTQTRGRGRGENSFYSPVNTGLYMSCLMDIPPAEALEESITPLCAVAVCRALEDIGVFGTGIKWVNDVYYRGKKICGILVEGCGSKIVCGIGINLTTVSFPDGLSGAGSIGVCADRPLLAIKIFSEIKRSYSAQDFKEEYKRRSCILGRDIEFMRDGRLVTAKAVDIDGKCRLVTDENGTVRVLSSGEIKIVYVK